VTPRRVVPRPEGEQRGRVPAADTGDEPQPADVEAVATHRMGANLSALAASQAATWAMSLLWTLVVPRLLGPAGMGMIVTGSSAAMVVGILLGLAAKDFLVRELVAERARGRDFVGTALVLRASLIPLYAGAIVLYAHVAHFSSQGTLVLYLAAGGTICTLLAEPVQATFQAIERMEYLAFGDVFNKTTVSLLGVGLALLGFGPVGLGVSSLVVAIIGLGLYARWVRGHVRIELRTNLVRIRSVVLGSLPYWALGVFFMVYLWIDAVILALMARPEVVGWYGAATKLFTTLMFLPAVIATAHLPRLVAAFGQGPTRFRAVARGPVELVAILSIPVCVVAAMTAHGVIPLLFGGGYRPAIPVMVVLSLCIPPIYVCIMLNQVLVAAKRPMVWTWFMAGATVVNPILNVALIPAFQARFHNGALGSAVALLLTEVGILVAGMIVAGRAVLDGSSLWRFAKSGIAGAAMLGTMLALRSYGFVAAALAGGVVFALLAWLLRLASPEELEILRASLARLRRRSPVATGVGQ
jgi:O-antigen/teichoic acid export membrane protein